MLENCGVSLSSTPFPGETLTYSMRVSHARKLQTRSDNSPEMLASLHAFGVMLNEICWSPVYTPSHLPPILAPFRKLNPVYNRHILLYNPRPDCYPSAQLLPLVLVGCA